MLIIACRVVSLQIPLFYPGHVEELAWSPANHARDVSTIVCVTTSDTVVIYRCSTFDQKLSDGVDLDVDINIKELKSVKLLYKMLLLYLATLRRGI